MSDLVQSWHHGFEANWQGRIVCLRHAQFRGFRFRFTGVGRPYVSVPTTRRSIAVESWLEEDKICIRHNIA
jgi:hypothetical protein